MKRSFLILSCFAGLTLAGVAQTTGTGTNTTANTPTSADYSSDYLTPPGTREVTISGGGGANKDLNDSFGTFNFSYGQFITNSLSAGLRQSVSYTNPNNDDSAWNGSSKIFVDQHFGSSRVRPFIGANLGYVYGEAIRDTWAAGLEGGVKVYVAPRTFVTAMADYGWFFQHADTIDNRFDDGQFGWTLGVGFNF